MEVTEGEERVRVSCVCVARVCKRHNGNRTELGGWEGVVKSC